MISVLFVSLFQAVVGAPADLPAPPPAAAVAPGAPSAEAVGTPAPNAAAVAPRDQMHCRRETVTGSRFTRRVCLTKAEEDAWRTDSRRWLEHAQSQMPTKGN